MPLELEPTNDEDPTTDEDGASDDEGCGNDVDSGAELEFPRDEDDPGDEDGGALVLPTALLLVRLLLPGPDCVLVDAPETPLEDEPPICEVDIPTDDETRLDAVELLDTPRLLPPPEEDPVALPPPHTPSWPHTWPPEQSPSPVQGYAPPPPKSVRHPAPPSAPTVTAANSLRERIHILRSPNLARVRPSRRHHRLGQCQVPRKTCAVHRPPSDSALCGAGAIGGFFPGATLR